VRKSGSYIWGWGPFAIRPQGEEFLAADRVRVAFRQHRASIEGGGESDRLLAACEQLRLAVEELWALVAKRVQSQGFEIPKGGQVNEVLAGPPGIAVVEMRRVPLVRNLIEASLVPSLVGIEYEIKQACLESAKFPTEPSSPAVWQVTGQATETATHRSMPGIGFSERFEPTDPGAVEAGFLVAASSAYVDAVTALVPFARRRE
jgi:hypothetical protein